MAVINYDTPEVLSELAQRRGVSVPLLADDDYSVILDFGILNTVVEEGLTF